MPLIPPPPELKPGSRVWSYLRDSGGTRQQDSVNQQKEVLTRYCGEHNLYLERVWADEAKSGTSDVGREDFLAMIDTINAGDVPDGILYWATSRLGRDEDDAAFYRALIRRKGIVLHSLTQDIPAGPISRIIEAIIDHSDAEKSRQDSVAVKRGLAALSKSGFAVGGFPPRGYLAESVTIGTWRDGKPHVVKRWVPDPAYWELCKTAWAMRARGCSLAEIRDATGRRVYKSKNCWTTFFKNKSYLGIGKCGEVEVPDHHPAMIDQATWDTVQSLRRQKRIEAHSSFNRAPSLLSGLARCGVCGSAMNKSRGGSNDWNCYVCCKRKAQGKAGCTSGQISQKRVDGAVLSAVLTRVLASENAALLAQTQSELNNHAATDAEIARLEHELAACERAIQNLLDLAEAFGAGSAAARLVEREAAKARLWAELAAARARRQVQQITITPAVVQALFDDWRTSLTNTTDVLTIRRVLTEFVDHVDLTRKRMVIWYSLVTRLTRVPPGAHAPQACCFSVTVDF